jgi:SsrA-binding protein
MSKQKELNQNTICQNKKARFDYFIEHTYEAGVVLEGWEVKSLRAGKGQLVDSYVLLKNNEAWLIGALITPLQTVSTHITPDPTRTRKLLLHAEELKRLLGAVQQKGFSIIPLSLYWKNNRVKAQIALAKGKKLYDKRETEKEKDWQREKSRIFRHSF